MTRWEQLSQEDQLLWAIGLCATRFHAVDEVVVRIFKRVVPKKCWKAPKGKRTQDEELFIMSLDRRLKLIRRTFAPESDARTEWNRLDLRIREGNSHRILAAHGKVVSLVHLHAVAPTSFTPAHPSGRKASVLEADTAVVSKEGSVFDPDGNCIAPDADKLNQASKKMLDLPRDLLDFEKLYIE